MPLQKRVSNVEALLHDSRGGYLVALGNRIHRGAARIARIDPRGRISTSVRLTDVEGLAVTSSGEIVFSNDELNTVFKISRRGGIFALVHLIDPDDLLALGS